MKTKLVTTLITTLFLAASGVCRVNAQSAAPSTTPAFVPDGKHEHRTFDPEKKLAHMTKRLDLTQQQQAQILPVLQQEAQTLKSLKENASLSQEQKRAQIHDSFKATHKEIYAFLTPDQQKKMHEMHHKHGGAAPGSAVTTPTPAA